MEDTKNMTLGKRILYYRKRMGMTQDQLAEQMGVTAQAVSKWEHDLSCPDVTSLPRLAEIFDISTDELLGVVSGRDEPEDELDDWDEDDDSREAEAGESGFWQNFRRFSKRYLWALFLIALGGTYLVAHFLKLNADFFDLLWPMMLLFYGFYHVLRRNFTFSALAILGGGYMLLLELGVVENRYVTWPVVIGLVLVLLGAGFLFSYEYKSKQKKRHHGGHTVTGIVTGREKATRVFNSNGGFIQADYAFCSDRIVVNEAEFAGGDVDVAFGSLVVDLRNCTRVCEGCTLKMDVAFGSLVILMPRHLRLDLELDRAGVSCDTSGCPNADAKPVLLRGDSAFSSLKIQYD